MSQNTKTEKEKSKTLLCGDDLIDCLCPIYKKIVVETLRLTDNEKKLIKLKSQIISYGENTTIQ
jgi:hypothetical protein